MHPSSGLRQHSGPGFRSAPLDPELQDPGPSGFDALDPVTVQAVTAAFALSAETRRVYPVVLGQHYGAGVEEYLDVYPARQPVAPILVFLPGGFAGLPMTAEDFAGVARGPFAHGITTVVVNYAHLPPVTLAEAARQVSAAIAWVHGNAARFGADPQRIVVAGHGLGGQLAAGAAVTDWEAEYGIPADVVTGVVLVSARLQPASSSRRMAARVFARQVELPVLVAVGTGEPEADRTRSGDLIDSWAAGGHEATLLHLPGENQYDSFIGYADSGSALTLATVDLFGSTGRRGSPGRRAAG
jgi:arylformamidase